MSREHFDPAAPMTIEIAEDDVLDFELVEEDSARQPTPGFAVFRRSKKRKRPSVTHDMPPVPE